MLKYILVNLLILSYLMSLFGYTLSYGYEQICTYKTGIRVGCTGSSGLGYWTATIVEHYSDGTFRVKWDVGGYSHKSINTCSCI